MNVNKQTIITLLLTLVAIAGRAQAFQYRIVGNIGMEFTGWLYLMNQSDKNYTGLVDTAMAKGDGLFWVMPVEKVARQIWTAIRKKKSKVYVTKRWHILAIINKNLPFGLYKRM